MQRQKSAVKDLKRKMSAKDSGLEIGTAPRMSRDMQLLIAENQALKYDVETLKDQLKRDQQIRQQMLLCNAEMQHAAAVDSEPILEKNDAVTCEIAGKHLIEGTEEDDPGAQFEAVTEPDTQNQDELSSEEAIKEEQSPEVTTTCQDAEVCLGTAAEFAMPPIAESGMPPVAESGLPPVAESGMPPIVEFGMPPAAESGLPPVAESGMPPVAEFEMPPFTELRMPPAAEQKDDFPSEMQCLKEVGKSEAVMKEDGMGDMCQEDEAVFEKTSEAKDETTAVKVEEVMNRKVPTQDGYQATGEESVAENIAKEQEEEVENMTEHLAEVTGDNQLILQDQEVISQLYAVSTRLQNAYDEAAELAEELELDNLSTKLSYDAILKGLKDNVELKMTDHQNEMQQMELKVKEEKTLREEEQAKVKALEEELNHIKLESKASRESQNAEIEKLREAVLEIGSRYSKSQDDYNEETKRVKTTLKACSVKMKELINANTRLKDENNCLSERVKLFIDKLNNETSVLRDQLASYSDKLDKEVKIRKGLEERNAELYTRLQEQEEVISELQAKKRRRKGWRRFLFCS